MPDVPCPNDDGQTLAHPDGMFCVRCVRRLPQGIRRAIFQVNNNPDPWARRPEKRAEVFARAERWFSNHPPGAPHPRRPRVPDAVLRYTSR